MVLFKALIKGVSGFAFIGSLAFSFAPATDAERAALGAEPPRLALVQRRMAIVFRDVAPAAVQERFAAQVGVSPVEVGMALDLIIEGGPLAKPAARDPNSDTLGTAVPPPLRTIRAGGALFVTAD